MDECIFSISAWMDSSFTWYDRSPMLRGLSGMFSLFSLAKDGMEEEHDTSIVMSADRAAVDAAAAAAVDAMLALAAATASPRLQTTLAP